MPRPSKTSAASTRLIVDKTGTLTEGKPSFDRVVPASGYSENEVLRLAASLDQGSEHPLAEAIVRAARERGLQLEQPQDFESSSGIGVRGRLSGTSGRARQLEPDAGGWRFGERHDS